MQRNARIVALTAMVLAFCVALPSCGSARVTHYKQAGLEIVGGNMRITRTGTVHFSALTATSQTTPITRFRFQQGIDRSVPRDHQLTDPPDVILTNIDNPNASMTVTIGEASISIGPGEHAISHAEVFHGAGTTPVWSSTWSSGSTNL